MSESPIRAFLSAIDALDLTISVSLFAPHATLSTPFGAQAAGLEQVRGQLASFLAGLRTTEHDVNSSWNPEPGVWIAEVSATYELTDLSRRGPYQRVIIVRAGAEGMTSMQIYGAQELPLPESGRAYTNVRGPHGWLPTL
jgi:hypothetical protein